MNQPVAPEKVYRGGIRNGEAIVTVEHVAVVEPLEHVALHSPTGFAWGYAGSGPADLAHCLLRDHFGCDPAPSCYQTFKEQVVASWPIDGDWVLRSHESAAWLERYQCAERSLER